MAQVTWFNLYHRMRRSLLCALSMSQCHPYHLPCPYGNASLSQAVIPIDKGARIAASSPTSVCPARMAVHHPAHLSFTSTGAPLPPTHRSWELSRLSSWCFLLLPCLSPLLLLGASASSPVAPFAGVAVLRGRVVLPGALALLLPVAPAVCLWCAKQHITSSMT